GSKMVDCWVEWGSAHDADARSALVTCVTKKKCALDHAATPGVVGTALADRGAEELTQAKAVEAHATNIATALAAFATARKKAPDPDSSEADAKAAAEEAKNQLASARKDSAQVRDQSKAIAAQMFKEQGSQETLDRMRGNDAGSGTTAAAAISEQLEASRANE